MGAKPDFFISLKLVLSPIAASADTIKNLLTSFIPEETACGITPKLLITARARNPRINQGIILVSPNFALTASPPAPAALRLMRAFMSANAITVGIIESVRVSFTIVAKSPAASENA